MPRLCHRRLGRRGRRRAPAHAVRRPGGPRLAYWNSDGSPAVVLRQRHPLRGALRRRALGLARAGAPHRLRHRAGPGGRGRDVDARLPAPAAVHPWQELAAAGEPVAGAATWSSACRTWWSGSDWPDFWDRPLGPLAPALRAHPDLPPGGANVTFVLVGEGVLHARSFERGVEGETLSCGSGVVAAALVALAEGWLTPPVRVLTASGRELRVTPDGTAPSCPVRLTGPAEWVADLEIAPEFLA